VQADNPLGYGCTGIDMQAGSPTGTKLYVCSAATSIGILSGLFTGPSIGNGVVLRFGPIRSRANNNENYHIPDCVFALVILNGPGL